MNKQNYLAVFIAAALLFVYSTSLPVYAAWSNDPAINNPISTATGNQNDHRSTSDGNGGSIIVWTDFRNGSSTYGGDIYVQRIDSTGNVLWTANGVAVATATLALDPRLASDGNGGAIITWEDYRNGLNYDIYAQRIDSNGNALWTANGVAICTAAHNQFYPAIIGDGNGGAIIAWQDHRSGNNTDPSAHYDIYAQKINSDGNVQWTGGGVAIATSSADKKSPHPVTDGSGGAIIVWQDYRNGTDYDIYAQRVDTNGNVKWTTNGVAIVTAAHDQSYQRLVKDGSGGAIITWQDLRNGTNYNVYAQRVDSNGNMLWAANGVVVSAAANGPVNLYPTPASDGSGGATIVWQDYRFGTYYHIYAQRIDSNGNALWTSDGVAISSIDAAYYGQWYPQLVRDSYGRIIITWFGNGGIFAQRIDSAGNKLWTANGVAVSTALATSNDYWPSMILDSLGYGAIIAWTDYRNGSSNTDIYAQKIQTNGTLPCANSPIMIAENTTHYPTIQQAYNAANGQTVQIQSLEYTETLTLNNGNTVKLSGGYYGCDFSPTAELAAIHGTVTIRSGTVIMDKLKIM
jgi:hypothetical protein